MQGLVRDVKYAARLLARQPGFTGAAIATLALGIGANTAIFSLADATLLRPVNVAQPERLASWTWTSAYPDFLEYTARTDVFRGVMAWSGPERVNVTARDSTTELAPALFVSGGAFDVMGVEPAVGRLLLPSDDLAGGAPAVVLSHEYWRRRYGGDASIVGRTLHLNGHAVIVVGVAQEGFRGVTVGMVPSVYVPLTASPRLRGSFFSEHGLFDTNNISWLHVVGRLRDDVALEQASSAIEAHYRRLHPSTPGDRVPPRRLVPFETRALGSSNVEAIRRFVVLLLGVVGLTLLVGCANLGNLLLARAAGRRHEVGIRFAIGATRWRVVRQMMIESTALTALGGAAGLLVASAVMRLLGAFQLPGGISIEAIGLAVNGWTLGATFALALCTGVLVGIAPAWQASGISLIVILRDDARGSGGGHARGALVAVQIAISLVLLSGSVLFARSLARALDIPTGFTADGVVTASINPRLARFSDAQARAFHAAALERVRGLPAVRAAGWTSLIPSNGLMTTEVQVAGYQSSGRDGPSFHVAQVGPGYFAAAGTRVLEGRVFTMEDVDGAPPVAVVSRAAAARFWAGRNPVGGQVKMSDAEGWRTVVGVVEDVTVRSLDEERVAYWFLPFDQGNADLVSPTDPAHLFVRADGDVQALVRQVATQLRSLDRGMPVYDIVPFAEHVRELVMPQRMGATLLSLFSLLALSLASVGIYGVASYVTQLRRRELAIRMALGADASDVRRIVLKHGAAPAAIGVLVGLGLAMWAARFARTFLYDVSTADPLTFTAAPAMLLLIALAATWLPARRAARIDPIAALRGQ